MDSLLGRYRNLTILIGVLFLQTLGLAVQVKRTAENKDTRLIRVWAVDIITPFERAVVWAQTGSNYLWHDYFFLRGVRAENRDLKRQIEELRLQQVRLSEDADQARRLQTLLGFQERTISQPVPAQVIGTSASDLSRSIYIDKGSNDKIAPDMAVITAEGIVGKVLRVFPRTSLVLMINDQSSGVGAMLDKTRLQGVVRGTVDGQVVLERVMSDETVKPGDVILSSGGDQIFPKGMPLGIVTDVKPGHEMFLNIHVKPAADLSRLEEVLVVTEKLEEPAPTTDTAGRVRAADILAERLPSVPDKPAATTGATPATPSDASGAATNPPSSPSNATNPAANPSPKPDAISTAPSPSDAPKSLSSTPSALRKAAPNSLSADSSATGVSSTLPGLRTTASNGTVSNATVSSPTVSSPAVSKSNSARPKTVSRESSPAPDAPH